MLSSPKTLHDNQNGSNLDAEATLSFAVSLIRQ